VQKGIQVLQESFLGFWLLTSLTHAVVT